MIHRYEALTMFGNLMRSIFFVCVWTFCLGALQPEVVAANTAQPKRDKSSTPSPRTTTPAKASGVLHEGAVEIQRWLAPLSPKKEPNAGLRTVQQWLKTYIVFRWGADLSKGAKKRWKRIQGHLNMWDPIALYRDIRNQGLHPELFAKLKRNKLRFQAPKPSSKFQLALGAGRLRVQSVPGKRRRKKRLYRVNFRGEAGLMPLLPGKVDTILRAFIRRATSSDLPTKLAPGQKKPFATLKGKHSRKVANWLMTRIPNTIRLVDQYFDILNVLEPIGKGRFRMDLTLKWDLKVFARDYPAWARYLKNRKGQFQIITVFLDKRYRRWMSVSYDRRRSLMRVRAILNRDGFLLCNDDWKPIGGTWRPLQQLKTDWYTRTSLRFTSSFMSASFRNIMLAFRVRPLPKQGATLRMTMVKAPRIKLYGGRIIRVLAKFFVSDGIEGLIRRVMRVMITRSRYKGMYWQGYINQLPTLSAATFRFSLPIRPSRLLTSAMRNMRRFRRRRRRGLRQSYRFPDLYKRPSQKRKGRVYKRLPRKKARTFKKSRRSKKKGKAKYRRYKSKGSLWMRIFVALFYDLEDAERRLRQ